MKQISFIYCQQQSAKGVEAPPSMPIPSSCCHCIRLVLFLIIEPMIIMRPDKSTYHISEIDP